MTAADPPGAPGYARDAALAALARIAPLAVQLIATPFVIASAGVPAYAVWALVMTTINLMLTADLGVVGIMQRYHGIARGRGDSAMGGRITATVLAVLLALLVVVTALGPLIADAVVAVVQIGPGVRSEAWTMFRNVGTLAVLQLVGLALGSYLAAHSRFAAAAAVSLTARLASAVAIVIALVNSAGLDGLLVAAYVDAGLAVLLGVAFCWRHLLTEVRRVVRVDELKELWSYAWRNQASAIGFVAQRESDVIMAAIMLPAALQATVAASAQLSAAVALAPTVLLVPLFTRLSTLAGGSRAAAVEESRRAETTWFSLALPFGAVVLATAPFIAAAWLDPALPHVTGVTALLVLGFLIVLANSVRAILVRAVGSPGIETVSYASLLVVKLAVGVPATLLFGIYGLAASTVVASLAAVAVMWWVSRRRVDGLTPGTVRPWSVIVAVAVLACGIPACLLIAGFVDDRWVRLVLFVVVAGVLAGIAGIVAVRTGRAGR